MALAASAAMAAASTAAASYSQSQAVKSQRDAAQNAVNREMAASQIGFDQRYAAQEAQSQRDFATRENALTQQSQIAAETARQRQSSEDQYNAVVQRERNAQQSFRDQADNTVDQALKTINPQQAQANDLASRLVEIQKSAALKPIGAASTASSTPGDVKDNLQNRVLAGAEAGTAAAGRQAQLESYGAPLRQVNDTSTGMGAALMPIAMNSRTREAGIGAYLDEPASAYKAASIAQQYKMGKLSADTADAIEQSKLISDAAITPSLIQEGKSQGINHDLGSAAGSAGAGWNSLGQGMSGLSNAAMMYGGYRLGKGGFGSGGTNTYMGDPIDAPAAQGLPTEGMIGTTGKA